MVLADLISRMKYGPIVEEGDFDDHREEYRDFIQNMEEVDVEVTETYQDLHHRRGLFFPTGLTTSESETELSGEEAWEFADSTLEGMMPNTNGIEDIPFYFEHRSRGEDDIIRMGARSYSLLGSQSDYQITFETY